MNLKDALSGSIPGDPPLLEELSINLHSIKTECLLPLKTLTRHPIEISVSSDVTGPLLILVLFSFLLVLQGKLHFGYIYLISLSSSFFLFLFLNLLTQQGVTYAVCCNVMGYSMTPVVAFSLLNFLLSWTGPLVRFTIGTVMSVWSAYTAGQVMCIHLGLSERTLVVGYPLFLAYMCYTMMVLF